MACFVSHCMTQNETTRRNCYTNPTPNVLKNLQHFRNSGHLDRWHYKNRISQTHNTFRHDHSRDSAMSQHGRIATRPQILFHSGAGRTIARPFQLGRPNPKRLILQCSKVDARNHNISAKQGWINLSTPQNGFHDRDMLGLN
jgi:hypothetical protein